VLWAALGPIRRDSRSTAHIENQQLESVACCIVDIPTLPEIRALSRCPRRPPAFRIYVSTTPQTQHVKASPHRGRQFDKIGACNSSTPRDLTKRRRGAAGRRACRHSARMMRSGVCRPTASPSLPPPDSVRNLPAGDRHHGYRRGVRSLPSQGRCCALSPSLNMPLCSPCPRMLHALWKCLADLPPSPVRVCRSSQERRRRRRPRIGQQPDAE